MPFSQPARVILTAPNEADSLDPDLVYDVLMDALHGLIERAHRELRETVEPQTIAQVEYYGKHLIPTDDRFGEQPFKLVQVEFLDD